MIEHSFWFLITLSFCFDAFAVMSVYHFNKRERMLNKYKTLLVICKAFVDDAINNEYQECVSLDLRNQIDEVLNEN